MRFRFLVFISLHVIQHRVYSLPVNDPCSDENLETTDKYRCDNNGKIICANGYTNPDLLCSVPSCAAFNEKDMDIRDCRHGNCTSPGVCSCEVGWRGRFCDICLRYPGCEHGTCNKPYECNCNEGYSGVLCNQVACPETCINGECIQPNICYCNPGWKGKNCNECITPDHCEHGKCVSNPFECVCEEGWSDLGCSQPICRDGCHPIHGSCNVPDECNCDDKWGGPNCDQYIGRKDF